MAFDPNDIINTISTGSAHFSAINKQITDMSAWLTDKVEYAVRDFSVKVPARRFEAITMTDAYTAPIPDGWIDGVSKIESIEAPIGSRPRAYLPENTYQVYPTATSEYVIDFRSRIDHATINVVYTGLHTWQVDPCTLPIAHNRIVGLLAASVASQALAGLYNDIPNLPTTSNSRQEEASQQWRNSAELFKKQYDEHIDQLYTSVCEMDVIWG